jgi:hypothetical protein
MHKIEIQYGMTDKKTREMFSRIFPFFMNGVPEAGIQKACDLFGSPPSIIERVITYTGDERWDYFYFSDASSLTFMFKTEEDKMMFVLATGYLVK